MIRGTRALASIHASLAAQYAALAFELVATKQAVMGVLETLTGTSPIDPTVHTGRWEFESPFPLDVNDPAVHERLYMRSGEIESRILRAVVEFVTAKADHLDECKGRAS